MPDHTGKRYRTKKERLRIEREGPPYRTDGSLDYGESMHATLHLVYILLTNHFS
jgi:hypothetical protein